LHMTYASTGEKVLHGVDVSLKRGEILGLLGRNEAGKTSLARALATLYPIDSGSLRFSGEPVGTSPRPSWVWAAYVAILSVAVATGYSFHARYEVLASDFERQTSTWDANDHHRNLRGWMLLLDLATRLWTDVKFVSGVLSLLVMLFVVIGEAAIRTVRGQKRQGDVKKNVLLITSEDAPAYRLFRDPVLIKDALVSRMPDTLSPEQREQRAIALLKAGGLQLYDRQGKPYGSAAEYVRGGYQMRHCSGGQRHLVYLLSMLAAEPEVMLMDEVLIGLDLNTQARVLAMIQHMATVRLASVLFITTDLMPVEFICPKVAFMRKGKIVEQGPVEQTLFRSQIDDVKVYVQAARGNAHGRHATALREKVVEVVKEVRGLMAEAML